MKTKTPRHRTPTTKQIKALQLMNQGYSQNKALLEAGYSKSYAHASNQFLSQPVVQTILIGMKDELIHMGLTQKYMAGKIGKWMEAKKDDDDNYEVQLKGFDKWKEMMDYQHEGGKGGIKRKLTIEEYVMTDSPQGGDLSK